MDIIDKNLFDPKTYDEDDIEAAYKVVFKDSISANLVLQDLIRFTRYNTNIVNTDEKMMYHQLGMQAVIRRMKTMLNTEHEDTRQLVASIEDQKTNI